MPYKFPRCRVVPLPDHQVAVEIEGRECLRWHFGPNYPRPFFYPIVGPSGSTLTRMGHPGAPNHDHHRSVWFAHNKVLGIDFWSDRTDARIRQKEWIAYQDGDSEAVLGTKLGWYDGHDPKELLEQEVLAVVRPLPKHEWSLELQSTFRPMADSLEFGKTNFGFLAVRVASNISAHFGGGELTNSEGARGEPNIFGKPARWMDYSGPVPDGSVEGITYIDHPDNPGQPTRWHVREDGWMGASPGMEKPHTTTKKEPLRVRYLLHIHRGDVVRERANALAKSFAALPMLQAERSKAKHQHAVIRRLTS